MNDPPLVPDPWVSQTLGEVLQRSARLWPDEEALVVEDQRRTFAELSDDVQRLSAVLADAGVRTGNHIAICLGNSVEWVTTFYAAALLGAVSVAVNTRFKADELRYCLLQADVSTLVVVDRFLDKIDFIGMLRTIEPAIDHQLPGRALPLLRSVLVVGSDVPAGCISVAEWLNSIEPRHITDVV